MHNATDNNNAAEMVATPADELETRAPQLAAACRTLVEARRTDAVGHFWDDWGRDELEQFLADRLAEAGLPNVEATAWDLGPGGRLELDGWVAFNYYDAEDNPAAGWNCAAPAFAAVLRERDPAELRLLDAFGRQRPDMAVSYGRHGLAGYYCGRTALDEVTSNIGNGIFAPEQFGVDADLAREVAPVLDALRDELEELRDNLRDELLAAARRWATEEEDAAARHELDERAEELADELLGRDWEFGNFGRNWDGRLGGCWTRRAAREELDGLVSDIGEDGARELLAAYIRAEA